LRLVIIAFFSRKSLPIWNLRKSGDPTFTNYLRPLKFVMVVNHALKRNLQQQLPLNREFLLKVPYRLSDYGCLSPEQVACLRATVPREIQPMGGDASPPSSIALKSVNKV
jgi:hypothetical protein